MVFLVCFAIAGLFWLLKNLSATFSHSISIPISLVNYPKDWIVYGPEHSELQLNVRARGFQLIQWNNLNAQPFEIDLNTLVYPKGEGKPYVLTNPFVPALHAYLGSKIEWDGQLKDTLFFIADRRMEKEVLVYFNGSMSAEKEIVSIEYSIEPSIVRITGPRTKIKELDSISTIEAHFEMLHDNLSTQLALTVPGCDSCMLSPNQVELKIILEELPSEELPSVE